MRRNQQDSNTFIVQPCSDIKSTAFAIISGSARKPAICKQLEVLVGGGRIAARELVSCRSLQPRSPQRIKCQLRPKKEPIGLRSSLNYAASRSQCYVYHACGSNVALLSFSLADSEASCCAETHDDGSVGAGPRSSAITNCAISATFRRLTRLRCRERLDLDPSSFLRHRRMCNERIKVCGERRVDHREAEPISTH